MAWCRRHTRHILKMDESRRTFEILGASLGVVQMDVSTRAADHSALHLVDQMQLDPSIAGEMGSHSQKDADTVERWESLTN